MFADLRFLDPEVDGGPVSHIVFGHALLHGCREREPSYNVTQQLLTFEVNTDLTSRFDSHFSFVRTTLAFPLMSLVSASS